MAVALYLVCLFAGLLVKGNALMCYECTSPTGESCTGDLKPCTGPETKCLTAYSEVVGGGGKAQVLLRTCDRSSSCKQAYSYNSPQMSMRIATACCSSDGCIPAHRPALPFAPAKPNGVKCPWCFEEQSQTCSKQVIKDCTGDETRCLHSTANVSTGSCQQAEETIKTSTSQSKTSQASTPEDKTKPTQASTPEDKSTPRRASTPEDKSTPTQASTPEDKTKSTQASTPEDKTKSTQASAPEDTSTSKSTPQDGSTKESAKASTPESDSTSKATPQDGTTKDNNTATTGTTRDITTRGSAHHVMDCTQVVLLSTFTAIFFSKLFF